MRSRCVLVAVSMLCFVFLIGSGVKTAFGQPSIVGEWLFDISGVEQCGAVITFFDDGTLEGYGLTLQRGDFEFDGTYTIDAKGIISGTYGLPGGGSESFTGKVDKKGTKVTIKTNGPNLKGIRLPSVDPVIPQEWVVKVSRLKGAFDPFTIIPQGKFPRLYDFHGVGTFQDIDTMTITVDCMFFLTSKSVAYGVYSATTVGGGEPEETQTGVLSGKINLSSGKLSFKVLDAEGGRITLSGVVK